VGPLGVPLAEPVTRPVTADALMCCWYNRNAPAHWWVSAAKRKLAKNQSPGQGSTIVITNDARGNKPPSNYQNYH